MNVEIIRQRAIIAVLWLVWAMGMTVVILIRMLEPGSISEIISGEFDGIVLSEGSLLVTSSWWFACWILAYLTMTIRVSISRWMNIVFGGLAAVAMVMGLATRISNDHATAMIVNYAIALIASGLIVWHAWKLRDEEA
jgi:hypothetical protein